MTLSSTTPTKTYPYTGPGQYDFAFTILDTDEIKVQYTSELGVVSELVPGTDFITTSTLTGGYVTMSYSATDGEIYIYSDPAIVQESSWQNAGSFNVVNLERDLDKIIRLIQVLKAYMLNDYVMSNWRGLWITERAYEVKDLIRDTTSGDWYSCIKAHTSGVFADDLASGYWQAVTDFTAVQTALYAFVEDLVPAPVVADVGKYMRVAAGPALEYGSLPAGLSLQSIISSFFPALVNAKAPSFSGFLRQGGISGGDVYPAADPASHTLSITATQCLDHKGDTELHTLATKSLVIPTAASTIYHVFLTKLNADAIDWTSQTSASDRDWNGVCWADSLALFIKVASSGTGERVATSPDGLTWTPRTSAADSPWKSVAWSPTLTLAVAVMAGAAGNQVMSSPDGLAWTLRATPGTVDRQLYLVIWSTEAALFIAIGATTSDYAIMTSANGIDWTLRETPTGNEWVSVASGTVKGVATLVAVSYTTTAGEAASATSADGLTWTGQTGLKQGPWTDIVWSPELEMFVVIPYEGLEGAYSFDGLEWFYSVLPVDLALQNVKWCKKAGVFIAISASGTLNRAIISPDGINWSVMVTPAGDNNWRSVAWSPTLNLAAAVGTSGTGDRVMTSPLNLFEFRSYTTEAGVAADADVDTYRWRTFWRTNAASNIVTGVLVGNLLSFGIASENVLSSTITTVAGTVNHSTFLPVSRIAEIEYGARDATLTETIMATDANLKVAFVVGATASEVNDGVGNAWGNSSRQKASLKPYLSTRKFLSSSGTLDLLCQAVRIRC